MELSVTGVILAFSAGVVSFLSPCVLPLVPGYLSYVTGSSIDQRAGCRRIYHDRGSGAKADRPGLAQAFEVAREDGHRSLAVQAQQSLQGGGNPLAGADLVLTRGLVHE